MLGRDKKTTADSVGQKDKNGLRKWVTKAVCGDIEVQRLSRLAVFERHKHNYRYRMVQNGSVIALFHTAEDVEEALRDPNAPTHNEQLLNELQRKDSRRTSTASTGSASESTLLDVPQRADSDASNSAGSFNSPPPETIKPSPPSALANRSPNGSNGKPLDRKVSFANTSSVSPPPDSFSSYESSEDAQVPPNKHVDLKMGSQLAAIVVSKANMTPEERAARRATLRKPISPAQEPSNEQRKVLTWRYDDEAKKWNFRETTVYLASEPFAEGAMRSAYRMLMDDDGPDKEYVAKSFNTQTEEGIITPPDHLFRGQDPDKVLCKTDMLDLLSRLDADFVYSFASQVLPDSIEMTLRDFHAWNRRLQLFQMDVEMQGFCKTYAKEYNKQDPPKEVLFLDAFLIVCIDKPELTIYACEPMIVGDYVKHNNNSGAVQARTLERNTPQAFSHFTYVHSNGKHIIVDIQGVGDTYTDPQVHSVEKRRFGLGNLGQEGIDAFFKTHRCNNICIGLGLAPESNITDKNGTRCVR